MNRKPFAVSRHCHYKVKAKDLKKGDRIHVSGLSLLVKSNDKNDYNERVLTLHTASGTHHEIMLIIPRKIKLTVTEHVFKSYKKNR